VLLGTADEAGEGEVVSGAEPLVERLPAPPREGEPTEPLVVAELVAEDALVAPVATADELAAVDAVGAGAGAGAAAAAVTGEAVAAGAGRGAGAGAAGVP
jgi:hypothetical protein